MGERLAGGKWQMAGDIPCSAAGRSYSEH